MTLLSSPPFNAAASIKASPIMPRWRRMAILLAAIAALAGASLAFFVAAGVWAGNQLPWSPALDLGLRNLAASVSLLGLLLFAGLLEVARGFAQPSAPSRQGPSEVAPAGITERFLTKHKLEAKAIRPGSKRVTAHDQPEQATVIKAKVAAWSSATIPDDA